MDGFKKNSYSHGFYKIELIVIISVLLLVLYVVFPKAKSALFKIKLNSAIDSATSYKESVNNYYVSQLLFDESFKLDGVYNIVDGDLVNNESRYNVLMSGNVPSSGYLDYDNNNLVNGCIVVDGYSLIVSNGEFVSASYGECDNASDVAFNF